VLVLCPSFVADCLETLEEIGIRGRQAFLAAGGEELQTLPCLNSAAVWVDGVTKLIGLA
jgi:ferrochelatase